MGIEPEWRHLEEVYGVITLGIVATCLAKVGLSVRVDRRRPERTFVFLAVCFAIVVAATVATVISAFLLRFDSGQSLLVVNNGLTLLGILLIVFGLLSHRSPLPGFGSTADGGPNPSRISSMGGKLESEAISKKRGWRFELLPIDARKPRNFSK